MLRAHSIISSFSQKIHRLRGRPSELLAASILVGARSVGRVDVKVALVAAAPVQTQAGLRIADLTNSKYELNVLLLKLQEARNFCGQNFSFCWA